MKTAVKIAVPKERRDHERRVAATPDTVKKLIQLGFDVTIEKDAGLESRIPDSAYAAVGATIAPDASAVYAKADIIFKIQRPLDDEIALMEPGCFLMASLAPYADPAQMEVYATAKINAFAMELMPRISRAQSMDILSSQSNLAGYQAVIDAAHTYDKAFPMMMTAAGTIAPARVMVMGVGVAGLQAIATARRLGAVVSATDVRMATKEQVESLGATFVMVEDDDTDGETADGYAKEMSEEYKKKQAALIAETIKKQNIVITTALIPGRPAPVLITAEMVATMQPGSVIIDLAAEAGGNCELAKLGEIVETDNGVSIVGHHNVPSRLATDASALFSKNLLNFISPHVQEGKFDLDWEDETVTGILLTRDGAIVHEKFTPENIKGGNNG